MMYKCCECGHIFDEGEAYEYRETYGEQFSVCPICGGEYEDASHCKGCGGAYLRDELSYRGYCTDCMKDMLTVEEFLAFADEKCDPSVSSTLEDFMFTEIFGFQANEVPQKSTPKIKEWLKDLYRRIVAKEKLLGTPKMAERIDRYMESIPSLWDEFFDYIDAKEVI